MPKAKGHVILRRACEPKDLSVEPEILRSAQDDKQQAEILRSAQDDKQQAEILRSAQDDTIGDVGSRATVVVD